VTRLAGVAGLAAALAVLSRFTGVATFSGAAFLFPRTDGTLFSTGVTGSSTGFADLTLVDLTFGVATFTGVTALRLLVERPFLGAAALAGVTALGAAFVVRLFLGVGAFTGDSALAGSSAMLISVWSITGF